MRTAIHRLSSRDLDGHGITVSALTSTQERLLQILGMAAASVSIALACLVLYWLMKMRRSFRHEYVSWQWPEHYKRC